MLSAGTGRRCAVLGSPVAHSLSPVLHHAAYDVLGVDWTYQAHRVDEASLPAFLDGLDDTWRGLSLTMPLKRSVVPLLDELVGRAAEARAVNTVLLEPGRRSGHNTDVPGVAAALRERYDGPVEHAVVVGGGATAASAVLALADLGAREITLLVRDEARAADTVSTAARHPAAPRLQVGVLGTVPPAADVLVSTVPVSAQGPGVLRAAREAAVVFEVVYDPWPTPLARLAIDEGRVLVSGLDLLVHQAVLQVELMVGVPAHPPAVPLLEAMRAAGERVLGERRSG